MKKGKIIVLVFGLISIGVIATLLFVSKNVEKEIYDMNNITLDMSMEKLGIRYIDNMDYNLDQIRDTYNDLYYFYEPLSQKEIMIEFETLINYELKVIDVVHSSINLESIKGYNYLLDESNCFIDTYKNDLNILYHELMNDKSYQAYLWDIDESPNPPIKWYFNKMKGEIYWVVKKDINSYITNQINIENINLLDKEMYVRIYKFETWIASKARVSCELPSTPDIEYQ